MLSVKRTKEIAQAFIDCDLEIKFWCQGMLNYASQDMEMLHMLKRQDVCLLIMA